MSSSLLERMGLGGLGGGCMEEMVEFSLEFLFLEVAISRIMMRIMARNMSSTKASPSPCEVLLPEEWLLKMLRLELRKLLELPPNRCPPPIRASRVMAVMKRKKAKELMVANNFFMVFIIFIEFRVFIVRPY